MIIDWVLDERKISYKRHYWDNCGDLNMDCILYHINGNYLGSDNGLVVTTEKVLVLIYLRVKNHDVGNLLSNGSAQCLCSLSSVYRPCIVRVSPACTSPRCENGTWWMRMTFPWAFAEILHSSTFLLAWKPSNKHLMGRVGYKIVWRVLFNVLEICLRERRGEAEGGRVKDLKQILC